MNQYFSEISTIIGQRYKEISDLESQNSLSIIGRFAESLLLNETITIPIYGPARELVILIRWFGLKNFEKLVEEGTINLCYIPGTFTYVSDRNRIALSNFTESGIKWLIGTDKEWNNIIDAIKVPLIEELNLSHGKASRLANRVSKYSREILKSQYPGKIVEHTYNIAIQNKDIFNVDSKEALLAYDNEKDNEIINSLLNIAKVNLDLECSSQSACSNIYGNELTWSIIGGYPLKNTTFQEAQNRINKILEFEDIPDIPKLVTLGWSPDEVMSMKKDPRLFEFREWLYSMRTNDDKSILKLYTETFRNPTSTNIPTKLLRIGASTLFGLAFDGSFGSAAFGTAISTIDAFWVDKLINGWNPKVFIDKHFTYDR
jgi:hypothetical protein